MSPNGRSGATCASSSRPSACWCTIRPIDGLDRPDRGVAVAAVAGGGGVAVSFLPADPAPAADEGGTAGRRARSEEHTSELKSLMRISYAVFCLKRKKKRSAKNKETTES